MATAPIQLLPRRGKTDAATLAAMTAGHVYAGDFGVQEAETWAHTPGGFRSGRILNIDQHAPVERMYRKVSSTMLRAV